MRRSRSHTNNWYNSYLVLSREAPLGDTSESIPQIVQVLLLFEHLDIGDKVGDGDKVQVNKSSVQKPCAEPGTTKLFYLKCGHDVRLLLLAARQQRLKHRRVELERFEDHTHLRQGNR